MFLTQFLTVALVHFLAVISPGPDFAMVTRNSLVYSTKVGIYTSLGLALGMMVHVAYSLLGIGLLIAQSIVLFSIIKYLGAGYLIYIGYMSLKAKPQIQTPSQEIESTDRSISIGTSIWTGFLTNVLNPKATLFMLALFTQVISPATPKVIQILYGLEMVVATFVWFSLVSLFFSNAGVKNRVQKYQHYIEKVTGGVLIALGIKVALTSRE